MILNNSSGSPFNNITYTLGSYLQHGSGSYLVSDNGDFTKDINPIVLNASFGSTQNQVTLISS
jgi:hypothetical protein